MEQFRLEEGGVGVVVTTNRLLIGQSPPFCLPYYSFFFSMCAITRCFGIPIKMHLVVMYLHPAAGSCK